MVSLLVASLLAADPPVHGGGVLGLGLGVPFKTADAGFQLSLKLYGELEIAPKVAVGLVVPVSFGFNSQNLGFNTTASYVMIDFMPGVRGSFAILDWVRAAVELGWGPSFLSFKANVFGSTINSERTDVGMRGALLVELAPPSLSGVVFLIEPVALQGRFASSSFSEYRFSVGVGYRR